MIAIDSGVSRLRFDPVEYIKKLRNAGVQQAVAELQAQELENVIEITTSVTRNEVVSKDLVTKKDLENTRLSLEKVMEIIRKEIETIRKEIADLRFSTLKFIIWTNAAVVVFLGGMIARGFHWV